MLFKGLNWALPLMTVLCCLCLLPHRLVGQEALAAGQALRVLRTPHLRLIVPAAQAEDLLPLAQQADLIYAQMAADAGYVHQRPLFVVLGDRSDAHNGFSMVVPLPLVFVELAPAPPHSSIHAHQQVLRTLIHEFAHHLSNDQDSGLRRVLRQIFGRIMPDDLLSLFFFYLSTPAHQMSPEFWQEGLAMWAESHYQLSPDERPGRGHDAQQRAIWRLALSQDAVPPPAYWRYIHHRYPFARSAYDWGLGYMRDLAQQGYDPWELTAQQIRRWPFAFNKGIRSLTGEHHRSLIAAALQRLEQEMQEEVALLQAQGASQPSLLTPAYSVVGFPLWRDDHRLVLTHVSPWQRPVLAEYDRRSGSLRRSWRGQGLGVFRGVMPFEGSEPWLLRQVHRGWPIRQTAFELEDPEGQRYRIRAHLRDADIRWDAPDELHLAAIAPGPLGQQRLVLARLASPGSQPLYPQDLEEIPTEGLPWYPSWRPGSQQLAWVESSQEGYRLLLSRLDGTPPQVLWQGSQRLMHPRWGSSGQRLYVLSDQGGVVNVFELSWDAEAEHPAAPRQISHVLGSVLAAQPSPDENHIALVLETVDGRGLAIIERKPVEEAMPAIDLSASWAAGAVDPQAMYSRIDLAPADQVPVEIESYRGLLRMRPRYWTPTSSAVPEGGWGIAAYVSDPLQQQQLRAGLGRGPAGGAVGRLQYRYKGAYFDLTGACWQSENRYEDLQDIWGNTYRRSDRSRGASLGLGLREFSGIGLSLEIGQKRLRAAYDVLRDDAPFPGAPRILRRERLRPEEDERYLEGRVSLRWGRAYLPDGYAPGTGFDLWARYRHSGLGADVRGNLAQAGSRLVIDVLPRQGQQFVLLGSGGWSDGERGLRRSFSIGGDSLSPPRGYPDIIDRGAYQLAGSAAWRSPLWRPFVGPDTSIVLKRQLVLEGFFDIAGVSDSRRVSDMRWYRSAGLSLHSSWLVWRMLLNPGIGLAYRIDDNPGLGAWFALDFPW